MQRSLIAKSALIFIMAGSMLAQTSSKAGSKTGAKAGTKPATKSAAAKPAAGGLPTKSTIQSFLKHMFNYKPAMTSEVKEVKLLPGTQIADATVNMNDPSNPKASGEQHLYILSDRKHAIAGAVAPFDSAEPKMQNGLPTQNAVTEFVRKHFMQGSTAPMQSDIRKSDLPGIAEVTVSVNNGQQGGKLYITTDGQWVLTGEVIPFGADPFAATRTALAKGSGISKGPANAPVTVVEFSDLECPACKAAQPVVDQLLAQEPDVRFVFQHFPLEQMHPWAFRAAQYADCVGRENNGAFWKFIENVYADQPNISTTNVDQKLTDIAGSAGADKSKIKACIDDPTTKAHIWASQQLGKSVEVQGTPTVFINGRKVASVAATGAENMKMLIEGAKKDK
jgi:protein-disulfide isomerase